MFDISIIIPVYNVEKYLNKCLDSIITARKDFPIELLLVNDGSTDNSNNICDYYASNYAYIKSFNKQNNGVSSARNYGITQATGKYIMFIDSDDYIDIETFDIIYSMIANDSYDLFCSNYFITNTIEKKLYKKIKKSRSVTKLKAIKSFLKGKEIGVNIFDKLFKRELLKEINFNEDIRIGEDLLFVFRYLNICNSIYLSNNSYYNYYKREDSAMNFNFTSKFFDILKVSSYINEFCKNNLNKLYAYSQALKIYNDYKTIERFYKFGEPSEHKEKIDKLIFDIKKYSIFKAFAHMSFQRFAGYVLIRFTPKFYLKMCKKRSI